MRHSLQEFLYEMGYQRVSEQSALFIKEKQEEVCLIQVTTATYDHHATKQDYIRNNQQLIFYWNGKMRKPVNVLNLIVVSSMQIPEIMELAQEVEGIWLLDEARERIILFENQNKEFDGIYKPLENWIQSNEEKQSYQMNRSWGTIGLIVLNILIFIWTSQKGDVYSGSFLFDMGAQNWYAIFYGQEYYRIITSMFLHFGWSHLFNNMIVLGIAGMQLEKKIGTLRFLVLYFIAGIAGNLVSSIGYAIQNMNAISAGASGAIYGVLGAVLIQSCFDKEERRQFSPIRIIFLLILSFYFSVSEGTVDYFAHAGGFLMGILVGAVFSIQKSKSKNRI